MTETQALPAAGSRRASRATRTVRESRFLRLLLVVFLVSLVLPIIIQAGPLRLSPYRLLLLVAAPPCIILWLAGSMGRIRLPDIALMLMCLWIVLSYGVIHGGAKALEGGGIRALETMGAYLMGRLLIRTPDDFYRMVLILFRIVLVLLPLALAETVLGRAIVLEIFRSAFDTYPTIYHELRFGLRRVQGPFEHPILFGVFCSSVFGLAWYVLGYGRSFIGKLLRSGIVGFTAFLSLSSGPLSALGAQIALIGWDTVLGRFPARWKVLAGLFTAFVLLVELVANRPSPQILISIVAFNASTAFNRLRIWEFGSASVMNHPLFGVGLNDWERPEWMVASIDMFWLVPAVQNGLPAALLLQLAFLGILFAVIFRKGLSRRVASYRTGYAISLIALYISGWTVHYWGGVYILLMFLLGAGIWFLDDQSTDSEAEASGKVARVGAKRRLQTQVATAMPEQGKSVRSPSSAARYRQVRDGTVGENHD